MLEVYDLSVIRQGQLSFSWKLRGNEKQRSYHITAADRTGKVFWDSREVFSCSRHGILCGADLPKGTVCTWHLTVTGSSGTVLEEDGEPVFTEIETWKAQWLEPDRVRRPLQDIPGGVTTMVKQLDPSDRLDPVIRFRKEFSFTEKKPQYGLLYFTAHGVYEVSVNGVICSDLLAPGYTSYGTRTEYQCYDVSSSLKAGGNTIDILLADGWYTGRIGAMGIGNQYGSENAVLFQLETDCGTFCSDCDTLWQESSWRYADLFIGSCQNQNFLPDGWHAPRICAYGMENLRLQSIKPVRELRRIVPTLRRSPNGELLLDAGQTIVGYIRLTLDLKKGQRVTLEHSEAVDAAGNFMQNIIGQNKNQTDVLIAGEDGRIIWQPKFTFHGFRYVRLSGTDDMDPSHYTVCVIGSPLNHTGSFTCSDRRLNLLQENILRSQQGNMICIPTDCPQREKTGWTGDMQVYAPTACLEMDVEAFLRHWLTDMAGDQLPDGQIPHIIPYIPSHDLMKPAWLDGVSAAGWSDAAVIVPWRLYEFYGDITILKESWPMMERYFKSLQDRAARLPDSADTMSEEEKERQKYIWNTDFQYGDWLMPSAVKSGIKSPEVNFLTGVEVATLFYALDADIMSKAADLLDLPETAENCRRLNGKIRAAFAEEFLQPDGCLKKSYQGLCVLALQMNAVPDRQAVLRQLVGLIHSNGDKLDAGFLSIPYLLPLLARCGEKDLANKILFCEEEPSWLYEIKMGATTLWESWDAVAPDGTPGTYSLNHFAFGCVGEYLFRQLAGISAAEPGMRRLRIEPDTGCGLSFVDCSYDSIWGLISVRWEKQPGSLKISLQLPPDVEADVVLSDKTAAHITGAWTAEFRC